VNGTVSWRTESRCEICLLVGEEKGAAWVSKPWAGVNGKVCMGPSNAC